MKRAAGVFFGLVLICFTVTAASAYNFDLNVWNVTQLQASGDVVHVDITGSTVTFTFVSGGGITNTFQAMQDIAFQPAVFSGSNSISTASSPYSLTCTHTTGNTCNADGFLTNPATFIYSTPNAGPGNPITATFTFANNVVGGLDATAFDVHVSYSGSCSGWVDGTLKDSATSDTSCTPVPEPITVFLGGTGLAALAYAGRKRLFSGGGGLSVA
jgi:PEP-CTERM motif-containing protein